MSVFDVVTFLFVQKGAADIKRLLNIRREKADLQKETTKQIQKLVCR